jgi:hypothetical protein
VVRINLSKLGLNNYTFITISITVHQDWSNAHWGRVFYPIENKTQNLVAAGGLEPPTYGL